MNMPNWDDTRMDAEEDFIAVDMDRSPGHEPQAKYCPLEVPDCEACQ